MLSAAFPSDDLLSFNRKAAAGPDHCNTERLHRVRFPDGSWGNDIPCEWGLGRNWSCPSVFHGNQSSFHIFTLWNKEFSYSFDNGRKPFLDGPITLDSKNCLDRYVPFIVSDGINSWHSVIHVLPSVKKSNVAV